MIFLQSLSLPKVLLGLISLFLISAFPLLSSFLFSSAFGSQDHCSDHRHIVRFHWLSVFFYRRHPQHRLTCRAALTCGFLAIVFGLSRIFSNFVWTVQFVSFESIHSCHDTLMKIMTLNSDENMRRTVGFVTMDGFGIRGLI